MIKQYFEEFKELNAKYKIAFSSSQMQVHGTTEDDYDVIVECIGHGYAHTKYRVVKNGPGLSTQQLAIICDRGNLCFGYRTEGMSVICVYTD